MKDRPYPVGQTSRRYKEYIVQWLGGYWNTYCFNAGAGPEITFSSLREARAFAADKRRTTIGYKRVVRRIVTEEEVE